MEIIIGIGIVVVVIFGVGVIVGSIGPGPTTVGNNTENAACQEACAQYQSRRQERCKADRDVALERNRRDDIERRMALAIAIAYYRP